MIFRGDEKYARELDAQDELAHYRDRFVISDPDLIYLDGNSLGRLPKVTVGRLREVVEDEWGQRLIRAWNERWFFLPETVGKKVAQLVGARHEEVVLADSTSVNLFKLAMVALKLRPGRTKIVTDDLNFPSDLYILQGLLQLVGPHYRLEVVPSADDIHGPVEGLAEAIDEETALVTVSHTTFKSAYTYDMGAITELAHRAGALALWDTSHSAGSVPVDLNGANADLAIGCTYKFLNGGPGSPAFIYVRRDLQDQVENPISGWMGQNKPFSFQLDYESTPSLRRLLTGSPPILSLSAVEHGVDLLLEAGMERLRAKSVRQTEYAIRLWEELLAPLGFRLKSPRQAKWRGSHITLGHDDGWRVTRALIEDMGVIPDFRHPDNIRLGIAPLYTSFADIHAAIIRLQRVVEERLFERFPKEAPVVT